MPEFALTNKVNHAHERIDALEKRVVPAPAGEAISNSDLLARVEKLEGELRALKARMGKKQ